MSFDLVPTWCLRVLFEMLTRPSFIWFLRAVLRVRGDLGLSAIFWKGEYVALLLAFSDEVGA